MNTEQATNAKPEAVCSTAMLGPLPDEDVMWEDGKDEWGYHNYSKAYSSEAMEAERQRCYALGVAAERKRCAGGHDLEAMCEAFNRLIEAHANLRSPFHQPVCADAQMALRVLRGIVAALRA